MRVTNNAEGGTHAAAVSTGNSGGASGTVFDAVSIGASTTIAYDSGQAAHGSLSVKHDAQSGSAGGYLAWQTSTIGTRKLLFLRCYLNVTALPSADALIARCYGSGSIRCGLWVTSTGALRWTNASGSTIQTSTNTVTTSSWARLEGMLCGDASAGQVETRLYKTADSLTATETQVSAASQNTGGTIDEIRWGNATGVVVTYYLDDLAATDLGYFGPASLSYTDYSPTLDALVAPTHGQTSFVPAINTLTCITRTSWGGQVALTGQIWPRGRKVT